MATRNTSWLRNLVTNCGLLKANTSVPDQYYKKPTEEGRFSSRILPLRERENTTTWYASVNEKNLLCLKNKLFSNEANDYTGLEGNIVLFCAHQEGGLPIVLSKSNLFAKAQWRLWVGFIVFHGFLVMNKSHSLALLKSLEGAR